MFPPGLAPKVNKNPPPLIILPPSKDLQKQVVDDYDTGSSSKDALYLEDNKKREQKRAGEAQAEVSEAQTAGEPSVLEQNTAPLKASPTEKPVPSNFSDEAIKEKQKIEKMDSFSETKVDEVSVGSESSSKSLAVVEKTNESTITNGEAVGGNTATNATGITNEADINDSAGAKDEELPEDKSGEAEDVGTEGLASSMNDEGNGDDISTVEDEAAGDKKSDIDGDDDDDDDGDDKVEEDEEDEEDEDDASVGMPPIIPQVEAAESSPVAPLKLVSDDSPEAPEKKQNEVANSVFEKKTEIPNKKRKEIHQSEDLKDCPIASGIEKPPEKKVSRADERESKWMIKYEELKKFKVETGRAYGISKVEQPSLYLWVNDQRKYYKRKENGVASPMTKGRIDLLNQVGFVWDGTKCKRKPESSFRDAKWMERYNELKKYKEANGHCRGISQRKQPRLYTWVAEQRKKFMRLNRGDAVTFPRDRLDLLNQLQFEWKPTVKQNAKDSPRSKQKSARFHKESELESSHLQSTQIPSDLPTPMDAENVISDVGIVLAISAMRNLVGGNRIEVQWSLPENGNACCQWWGATVLPYDGRVHEYEPRGQIEDFANVLPVRVVQYDQGSARGFSAVDVVFLCDHLLLDLSTQGLLCWRDAGDLNNYQLPPSVSTHLTKTMFERLQAIGFIWVSANHLKFSRTKNSPKRGSVSLSLSSEFISHSTMSSTDDHDPNDSTDGINTKNEGACKLTSSHRIDEASLMISEQSVSAADENSANLVEVDDSSSSAHVFVCNKCEICAFLSPEDRVQHESKCALPKLKKNKLLYWTCKTCCNNFKFPIKNGANYTSVLEELFKKASSHRTECSVVKPKKS